MMRFLTAAALLIALPASAQQAVLQAGPITPGHVPAYISAGSQPVVIDGGPASGGNVGVGVSEIGMVAPSSPTGEFGTNFCDYDAPVSSGSFHYLCFSANAGGNGPEIAVGAGGSASSLPLTFYVNGALMEPVIAATGTFGQYVTGINSSGVIQYSGINAPQATTIGGIFQSSASNGQFVKGVGTDGHLMYDWPAGPTNTQRGGVLQSGPTFGQYVNGVDSSGNLLYSGLNAPQSTTIGGVYQSSASNGQFVIGVNTSGNLAYANPPGYSGTMTGLGIASNSGCSGTNKGQMLVVTDSSQAPSYNTVLNNTGGGSYVVLVVCDAGHGGWMQH